MNNLKNENGLSAISLIIILIIIILVIGIGFTLSKKALDKTKLEDIKTDMLLIQGKAKAINEKFLHKEIEALPGIEYNSQENMDIKYKINDGLKNELSKTEGSVYILEQNDLNDNGLSTISVNENSFYIVDYETKEVYYSKGYEKDNTVYYSLTELQSL